MAEVEGAETYKVYLTPDGYEEYGAFCSCPSFDKFDTCKHLWATLLAADAQGLPWLADIKPNGFLIAMEPEDFLVDEAEDQKLPDWRLQLSRVRSMMHETPAPVATLDTSEILYVLDVDQAVRGGNPVVQLYRRKRKTNGDWGTLKTFRSSLGELALIQDPVDRKVLGALHGARADEENHWDSPSAFEEAADRYRLEAGNADLLVPLLCQTGRFYLRRQGDLSPRPLEWDAGEPWILGLNIESHTQRGSEVRGFLERPGERMDLAEPDLLLMYGQLFAGGRAARFEARGAFAWVNLLRERGRVVAPVEEVEALVEGILELPSQPLLNLPAPWVHRDPPRPQPQLVAEPDQHNGSLRRRVICRLRFSYEGTLVDAHDRRQILRRRDSYELFPRDPAAEQAAQERLLDLGARSLPPERRPYAAYLAASRFPELVRILLGEGWRVEADGRVHRPPGKLKLVVGSGVDWFELSGGVDFEGQQLELPELLKAVQAGEKTVRLGDGSIGLLPEEWLERAGLLASLGKIDGDTGVRFNRSQGFLLDALLAADAPGLELDRGLLELRERLHKFDGIAPRHEPATFQGELREYQRHALGWFHFLQGLGFGGCLADDMGLGKTVQVLALLEERRSSGTATGPNLVVVPRSLVFNWLREAERFTPQLKTLDYTGVRRKDLAEQIPETDLIVTTYGVLRRDILKLKDQPFDYAILDEAQAIKNPQSQGAKAARLLRAKYRLALSGTPIENHLGELWSLFEFLNPGMLGRSSTFRDLAGERQGSETQRQLLARAVRPFILRRTKEEVVQDLPEKIEQTLVCEMKPRQRHLYDELKAHYRRSLKKSIGDKGLNKARMQVLEALLRLRQAACHPGLIDKAHAEEPSAKLEVLIPKLVEVCEQGHKALVFSQFTSMLALVRRELEAAGLEYEYLDGQTHDRSRRVERFQSDDGPPVFLISLKAGGVGLNLTAADYVFILDPWWNPAVEAQAIDRAHRIGQTRAVFAYRLVCDATVEEKILELQHQKRELADAIISSDGGVLRGLDERDLDLLLS